MGRLNGVNGWCQKTTAITDDYIQVDMGALHTFLFIFLNRCANRPNRMNLRQSHVCFWFINCAKKIP